MRCQCAPEAKLAKSDLDKPRLPIGRLVESKSDFTRTVRKSDFTPKPQNRPMTANPIFVGTAGWSYPDWKGVFYPASPPQGFDELAFLAQHVDLVEINASYYHPPAARAAKAWLARVAHNPRFRFTAKLWQRFVMERTPYGRDEERLVQQSLDVLQDAGRLGALLIQFPQSFYNTIENRSWLFRLFTSFKMYPLVVEVRHRSWDQPEVLELLARSGAGFANIDQPVIGNGLGWTTHRTAAFAYIRLHGRNTRMWFNEEASRDDRYDYLYTPDELKAFVAPVQELAQDAEATYVVFNNHYYGQAAHNAFEFLFLLHGEKLAIPRELVSRYPALLDIRSSDTPGQMDLFAGGG